MKDQPKHDDGPRGNDNGDKKPNKVGRPPKPLPPPHPLEIVEDVQPADILFGRGQPFHSHPGNQRMKMIIASNKARYMQAKREEKKDIISSVMQEIQGTGPTAGRFLKRHGTGPDASWCTASPQEIYKKVSHTLREKGPTFPVEALGAVQSIGEVASRAETHSAEPQPEPVLPFSGVARMPTPAAAQEDDRSESLQPARLDDSDTDLSLSDAAYLDDLFNDDFVPMDEDDGDVPCKPPAAPRFGNDDHEPQIRMICAPQMDSCISDCVASFRGNWPLVTPPQKSFVLDFDDFDDFDGADQQHAIYVSDSESAPQHELDGNDDDDDDDVSFIDADFVAALLGSSNSIVGDTRLSLSSWGSLVPMEG